MRRRKPRRRRRKRCAQKSELGMSKFQRCWTCASSRAAMMLASSRSWRIRSIVACGKAERMPCSMDPAVLRSMPVVGSSSSRIFCCPASLPWAGIFAEPRALALRQVVDDGRKSGELDGAAALIVRETWDKAVEVLADRAGKKHARLRRSGKGMTDVGRGKVSPQAPTCRHPAPRGASRDGITSSSPRRSRRGEEIFRREQL